MTNIRYTDFFTNIRYTEFFDKYLLYRFFFHSSSVQTNFMLNKWKSRVTTRIEWDQYGYMIPPAWYVRLQAITQIRAHQIIDHNLCNEFAACYNGQ